MTQGTGAGVGAGVGEAVGAAVLFPTMVTNTSSSLKNDELTNYSSLFDEFFYKILENVWLDIRKNWEHFEKLAREKNVEIVDLVKGFPTHIWSQKSASIQPRTDWLKFEIEKMVPR